MDFVGCLFCRKTFPYDPFSPFCPGCGEGLLVAPALKDAPGAIRPGRDYPLERFADFLPLSTPDRRLSLGEGDTPLVFLGRLAASLGIPALYAKNEGQNPTGSFKDRGTALAIQKAVALGFKKVGTVSTGNMAASTAAYGARAGIGTFVLLKEGTSRTSIQNAGVFGPTLVAVRGDYGRLFHDSLRIGRKLGICFLNSIDPFRIEGYKVTGFEIFLQLGRLAPDFVFVPLSSGGHLLGLMRAFEDLGRAGLTPGYPTFVGVQAEGCAPLVEAYETGRPTYERLTEARTMAHAISNPAPPGGNTVLKMIRDHGGILVSVSDAEMLAAQRSLASSEGLFCQPESAVTLAGLIKLRDGGALAPAVRGRAVLVLTGSGLKSPQALDSLPLEIHNLALEGLEDGLRALA
ncbi:MAG: threonine synthase [Candidatus Aminicenantales bacterium]